MPRRAGAASLKLQVRVGQKAAASPALRLVWSLDQRFRGSMCDARSDWPGDFWTHSSEHVTP